MFESSHLAAVTPSATAQWFGVHGTCIRLRGEFDLGAAPLVCAAVSGGVAEGRRHVVIDLGRATFLDCACLGAILSGMTPLRWRDDATLVFAGATGTVERLLRLLDFDRVCSMVGSVEAAKQLAVDPDRACLDAWRMPD